MALSARQQSKVIKMLGPFCVFWSTSVKNGLKTTTKPRIQKQCKIIFCTGMGDTTATNWMPVHFEGKSATAVSRYSNRRGARKEST